MMHVTVPSVGEVEEGEGSPTNGREIERFTETSQAKHSKNVVVIVYLIGVVAIQFAQYVMGGGYYLVGLWERKE
jgi:hypothetical protein